MNLSSYDVDPNVINATFVFAVMGIFGALFLFSAVFGRDFHQLNPVRWQVRLGALGLANATLVGVPLVLMYFLNLTLADLWQVAFVWKNADVGPFGFAVFAIIMIAFATPVLSLYAFASTMLQRRRELCFPRKLRALCKETTAFNYRLQPLSNEVHGLRR